MDLLEEILEKVKTILQDANEIDTYIVNDKKEQIHLKTTNIRNNADDIKEIFKQLKKY
jgi:DNA-binding protein H-NS